MIKTECDYCGKELIREFPYQAKGYNYCNASCQMKNEYKLGIRDKNKITKKARKVSHKKIKKHNWLNDKSSRNKLKKVQQTIAYKLKSSLSKIGRKNPMYGKKGESAGHYKGGSKRKYGTASRGAGWKIIRKKIKERDNYKCRGCGISELETKQNLQVHHKIPYKCTKNNSEDNLITLCSKCHAKQELHFYKVQKVEKKKFKGKVYNFSVDKDEMYFANNILVHNCRTRLVVKTK